VLRLFVKAQQLRWLMELAAVRGAAAIHQLPQ
jgi:hypothetical protein